MYKETSDWKPVYLMGVKSNMFKSLFCVLLIAFHAFTSALQNPWLNDINELELLRGGERQTKDKKEVDYSNDSPEVMRDDYVTSVASKHESMLCGVASHSNGTKTSVWNTSAVTIWFGHPMHKECHPYPTVVELKKGAGVQLIPPAITLHRCVGGCTFTQLVENCTVTSQQEVNISVTEIATTGSEWETTWKTITVYNHTACDCDCMVRRSDCDEVIHTYDPSTCDCQCKQNGSSCDPAKQIWNTQTCQCECTNPLICDSSKNSMWNETSCQCDCTQRVKDRCKRKNKVLNTVTCECDCPTPVPTCPISTSFRKKNCTCV